MSPSLVNGAPEMRVAFGVVFALMGVLALYASYSWFTLGKATDVTLKNEVLASIYFLTATVSFLVFVVLLVAIAVLVSMPRRE